MKSLVVLCFVITLAFTKGLPTGNSSSDEIGLAPRIIDGTVVGKTLFYEAAIVSDDVPVKLCSGAFITPSLVLTSAFCAKRRPVLRVYYGTNNMVPQYYEGSQLVQRAHCHPNYNALNSDHDIAILELAAPVPTTRVTLASLPTIETVNFSYKGLTAVVSGWGPSPGGTSTASRFCLESKKTVVIDNLFCTREGIAMSGFKLCTENRAVCDGDQGAPLVIDDRIVIAIATGAHNVNDCQGANVTPYTRVVNYLRWINQIAGTGTCTTC